jgi:Uma2 family endonuclease
MRFSGVMAQVASVLLNVHDFMDLPDGPPYYELVEGELFMSPAPIYFHQGIAGNIVRILNVYLDKRPIGEVVFAPCGVFLTEINAYQPDVFYICNERLSIIVEHGIEGAPDLVVEILSPSTAKNDKGPKKKIYAAAGVQELWLIDPKAKEVAVYDLPNAVDSPKLTIRANGSFESPLFPGLVLKGAEIFRDPRVKSPARSRRKRDSSK